MGVHRNGSGLDMGRIGAEPMREYAHVLRPSVAYLERCGRLLLDTEEMAEFLGIPAKAVQQMTWTKRLPPVPAGRHGAMERNRTLEMGPGGLSTLRGGAVLAIDGVREI